MHFSSLLVGALAATAASGHGTHDIKKEAAVRRSFLENNKRDLSHCYSKMKARGLEDRNVQRRAAKYAGLAQRGVLLDGRALSDLNKSHFSDANYTLDTPADVIFSGNASCVLGPEVTEGPYYVAGEYFRSNLTDGAGDGLPLHLELQILDMDTCEPVEGALAEIWHANATGVYSGVAVSGNGNGDDTSNLNETFLRGVQQTDDDGVVAFDTMFPGYYGFRATHIHVLVHQNATVLPNGTLMDTSAAHVGQIFFDQDLIYAVNTTYPYISNTNLFLENSGDDILSSEAEDVDPFMDFVTLTDDLADGLLGWLAIGINTSLSYNVTPAAFWTNYGGIPSNTSVVVTPPAGVTPVP